MVIPIKPYFSLISIVASALPMTYSSPLVAEEVYPSRGRTLFAGTAPPLPLNLESREAFRYRVPSTLAAPAENMLASRTVDHMRIGSGRLHGVAGIPSPDGADRERHHQRHGDRTENCYDTHSGLSSSFHPTQWQSRATVTVRARCYVVHDPARSDQPYPFG